MPLIERIYAATAEEAPWQEVAVAFRDAVGAFTAALFSIPGPKTTLELLHGSTLDPAAVRDYVAYYQRIDPMLHSPTLKQGGPLVIARGEKLVPQEEYLRSEFYIDYAKKFGMARIIGALGTFEDGGEFRLVLHRPQHKSAFRQQDMALLMATVPHLRRGLQIRRQLGSAHASLSSRMLDALPVAALVVDTSLTLRYANAPAASLCTSEESGIRLVRDGARPGAPLTLRLRGSSEMAKLTLLVRSVALHGTSGGAFRLRPGPDGHPRSVAILVSPLPTGLQAGAPSAAPGRAPGLALVILRPLDGALPVASVLQDLFGLTPAEAEVALGLAGGTSAEKLAERRERTLATIRAQVRAVLDKTGTMNLRELEALLASLAVATPPRPED
nr:hypothetical protein [Roseomonas sp. SXEYE001]